MVLPESSELINMLLNYKKYKVTAAGVLLWLVPILSKAVVDTSKPLDSVKARLLSSGQNAGFNNAASQTQLLEIVGAIVEGVLALLGVFFFIYVIYAGVTWATAGGNADRVEKAKSILKNNFIGLVMVLFAGALVAYVMAAITEAAG